MRGLLTMCLALMITLGLTVSMAEEGEATLDVKMRVQVGDYEFIATLYDNAATHELVDMLKLAPLEIDMDDYAGFEKVGALDNQLTADDVQTTTAPGDIVLYNGDNIVMFYGSNSWSYTRIGHIDDLTDWGTALGSDSIAAVFSLIEDA